MYEQVNRLCSVTDNYFPYKKLLLTQTPPLIPYLGLFLRDLTTLEVGNPTYMDEGKKLINYEKFRMIAAVFQDFQKYQQVRYQFAPDKRIQTALRYSLGTKTEKELYLLSRELEPHK